MRTWWAVLGALLIGIALSITSPLGAQQISGDVPVWQLGDLWQWRWEDNTGGGRSGTFTRTVTKVDEVFEGQRVYWTSRGDGTFSVFSADDLRALVIVDASGNVRSRSARKGDKTFPLTIGRTFTYDYEAPDGSYKGTYSYKVVGVEEVRVPAGAFQAFRVTGEGKGTYRDGRPFTVTENRHFAPLAKNWVRYTYTVDSGYKYTDELTRYQVRE